MKKFNYAVIMAAGRGMRMMPLTETLPKAMAPFNGTTLIANGIERIKPFIDNIYITVGHKGSELARHVIEHKVSGILNTTGHENCWWIFNTLMKFVDEPVVVLTCDNVTVLDFDLLLNDYQNFNQPACMLIPVKPVEGLEGDFIFQEKNKVKKLSRTEVNETYCSGIQVLNPRRINYLIKPAIDFNNLWEKLIELDEVYCSRQYPSKWFTADTLEQLEQLNTST